MSHQSLRHRDAAALGLPLPPATMPPEQQLDAVQRGQNRVEHRVKLGVQLFRSVEAQVAQQQDLLARARTEQARLRAQLESDATRSRRAGDHWMGQADDRLAQAIDQLDQRLETMQAQWEQTQARLEQMVRRAESLMHQGRSMLETGQDRRPNVQT